MTVLEAKYRYGTRQKRTSVGDSLTSIVRSIYDSDDKKYITIVKTLNIRFDWTSIRPGSVIEYLSPQVAEKISEV